MQSRKSSITWTVVLAMFAMAALTTGTPAAAQTEKVLYNFSYDVQPDSRDGQQPYASLIFDAAGNLYGTTLEGGIASASCPPNIWSSGCGTVFELMPQAGGGWTEKVLHIFNGNGKDIDGTEPLGGLIFDSSGNLYGTTSTGGTGSCTYGCGTVFELMPQSGGWTEKILHHFGTGAPDGQLPSAGLIFDTSGNLYGTTTNGGLYGVGTVFELTPQSEGWTEKILHNFGDGASDGKNPQANLIFDASGNLYSTTEGGGRYGGGTVFELMPTTGGWTRNVLHNFNNNGKDGYGPYAGLIFDAAGNLYSTTAYGGTYGYGTVFELTPQSEGWTETILYSIASGYPGPLTGVIFDAFGNLYGTTDDGGATNGGIVFELTPAGGGTWTGTIVHNLMGGTTDGCYVHGGLVFDAFGNLYGTTALCGAYYDRVFLGDGTVFEITP
jgi:uncharacterized repeat protein (TIGR03803 family)